MTTQEKIDLVRKLIEKAVEGGKNSPSRDYFQGITHGLKMSLRYINEHLSDVGE